MAVSYTHLDVYKRQVQSAVLERHVGTAVVCSAYAGVRTDNVYRQLSVSCGHECLVKCTAGSEAAEGVHEYGAAGRDVYKRQRMFFR